MDVIAFRSENGRKTEKETQDYFQITRQVLMERGLKHGMKHGMREEGMRNTRSEEQFMGMKEKSLFSFFPLLIQREMERRLQSRMNKKNSDSLESKPSLSSSFKYYTRLTHKKRK